MRPSSKWFNSEIGDAKRRRRQAERRWRKSKRPEDRVMFVAATREFTSLSEKAKRHFYLDKFNNVTSCKELFRISDELLGKQKSSPLPDGSDQDVANLFSKFFTEKISLIRNTLDSMDTLPP